MTPTEVSSQGHASWTEVRLWVLPSGICKSRCSTGRNHLGKVIEKQGLRAESWSFNEFSFFPLSLMADFARKWSSVARILLGNGALWLFLPPRHAVDIDASNQRDGEREVSLLKGMRPPGTLLSAQEEALSEQGLIKGCGPWARMGSW